MLRVDWLPVLAETGSQACAPCHLEIFKKHQKSGMARSGGRVGDGLEKAEFPKGALAMEWFLGSGAVGRSYAGFVDGFLFQSPSSYY